MRLVSQISGSTRVGLRYVGIKHSMCVPACDVVGVAALEVTIMGNKSDG